MGLPLIIYAVFATVVLVFCTISRVGRRAEYIGISIETLNDLARKRDDLIVVDLRKTGYETISNSLRVPAEELKGFLQWVPEHSILVLCGLKEVASWRDGIEILAGKRDCAPHHQEDGRSGVMLRPKRNRKDSPSPESAPRWHQGIAAPFRQVESGPPFSNSEKVL